MTIVINGTTGISGVDGSAGTPAVQGTDTNTGVFFPAADTIAFTTGGTEDMRIDSSGNVKIGTSNTPSNKDTVTPKLVVNGSGVAGAMQVVRNTTVGAGGAILELTATRGSDVNSYTILQSGDGVGSVVFGGADGNEFVVAGSVQCQVDGTPGDNDMPGRLIFNTTADGASSPSERMRIDSSGNVGIGTAGGTYGLALNRSSNNGSTIQINNSTLNASFLLQVDTAGTAYVQQQYAGALAFATSNSEKMRIDSSGNVGIGTSSPSSYGRLAVMTPTANYGYFGIANSVGGAGGVNMAQYYGTTKISYIDTTLTNGTPGSETAFLAFATANSGTLAERMRIDSSGNVGIGTSSPSYRLHVANSSATSTTLLANILARLQSNASGADASLQFSDNVANSAGISLNQGNMTFSIAGGSAAQIDTSANFKFNSGYGSAATAYGCRAWVNFNGTGVVAIRASGNVTSLTDNGTGNYTVNLTTSMPDANYSVVANHDSDNYSDGIDARATGTLLQTLATGSFILRTYSISVGTNQQYAKDYTTNTAAIFR